MVGVDAALANASRRILIAHREGESRPNSGRNSDWLLLVFFMVLLAWVLQELRRLEFRLLSIPQIKFMENRASLQLKYADNWISVKCQQLIMIQMMTQEA